MQKVIAHANVLGPQSLNPDLQQKKSHYNIEFTHPMNLHSITLFTMHQLLVLHLSLLRIFKLCTILGTRGATLQKLRISSTEARASINNTSAPASANAFTRQRASSMDTAWRASLRATMTMSEPASFRASTAARILITASSLDTTFRCFV